MMHYLSKRFTTFAGLPMIRQSFSTVPFTTDPAEMTEPLPMVVPGRTMTPVPNHTLSSMTIGCALNDTSSRLLDSMSWPEPSMIWQFPAMRQFLPIEIEDCECIQLP